ncbi:helix-turn-helix domain-containing protein [Scytonema sp. UIC 10036]|uniref:helix-turn-helix domain-containing protein n=1 Tax=Scytonema sp. UIC 10036 TaxID=2304196 RepID=UPI0012DA6A84|nr:helix-turn-helix domain-containing protein [Scytonema sp. UIC 10036]MUG94863.1 helix-turn-helix domain-containing protein [Scytonema sp. UIC 10036]
MIFLFEERPSDSSFVETIWRTQSEGAGSFTSVAVNHWEMVITKQHGKTTLTVRGPETKASTAHCPEDAEFFGIQFKLGIFMPHLPLKNLVNQSLTLSEATSRSFWLNGSAWQFPDYENSDTFVNKLIHDGLLVREPIVDAALQSQLPELSLRSIQRRFLQATGLTHSAIRQIDRARQAAALLEQGMSILDTVHVTGYSDQPHMTKALKHLLGQTPGQIARLN